jgi:hypothetical protein
MSLNDVRDRFQKFIGVMINALHYFSAVLYVCCGDVNTIDVQNTFFWNRLLFLPFFFTICPLQRNHLMVLQPNDSLDTCNPFETKGNKHEFITITNIIHS